MLHHLNEVGDNLCLKFSRRKHNLTHPNLSDETDSQPRCWYDPSQPLFQTVHAAGENRAMEPSLHTQGANVWQLPYFICLENSVFTTLSFVLLLKKKTVETFMKAFIGYNTHDMTPEELLDYSKTRHARCKNVNVLFHIKYRPPLTQFLSNHVRWQQYFCYKGDFFSPHICVKSLC